MMAGTRLTLAYRAITAATGSVTTSDCLLGVRYTVTGSVAISLPAVATVPDGFTVTINDEGLNASVNNITVTPNGSEKIDGAANQVIVVNGSSLTLYSTGTNWKIW